MAKKNFNTMLGPGPGAETTLDAAIVAGAENVARENPIYWISLDQINTNPFQPRLGEDEKHILNLALSIRSMKDELRDTMGLQQIPMARIGMVREAEDGSETFEPLPVEILGSRVQVEAALATGAVVELAFGHSRWWAFMVLSRGVGEVFPALAPSTNSPSASSPSASSGTGTGVVDPDLDADYISMPLRLAWLDDRSMSDHAATENAQRKNITSMEEAIALARRVNELGMNQTEAGKPFGLSPVQVSNKIRLLRLPEDIQWQIQTGELNETHGRALLQLVNAPHMMPVVLEAASKADGGGTPTSRAVLRAIEQAITYDTVDLPDEDIVEKADDAHQGGSDDDDVVEGMLWPAGWMPGAEELGLVEEGNPEEMSEALQGACGGCALRVQIGKEKILRCTDRGCHRVKVMVWKEVAKAAQISLMMERYGRDRVYGDQAGHGLHYFGRYNASRELITSGLCSMEKCACMVVVWKSYWADECERPDAEEAPDMVFACSDSGLLTVRENSLLEDDEASAMLSDEEVERRQLQLARDEVKQTNETLGEVTVERVVSEVGGLDALFEQRGFLMVIAGTYRIDVRKDWTVEQIRAAILRHIVRVDCRDWVSYSGEADQNGAGFLGYSEPKIERLVRQVMGRPEPKKGEDVDPATWQDDWEEADDSEWLMIEGMGSSLVAELVTRPQCALRLISCSAEKADRAKWWRRYKVLTNLAE